MDTPTPQSYSDIIGQVYVLCDPKTGTVRYVGKTIRDLGWRLKKHMLPSSLRPDTYKNHWIKSLEAPPLIESVEECKLENIDDAERFWISQFRALGFNLTNATEGGEGTLGHKQRPRDAAWRARLGAAHRGKRISEEQRRRLSEALKGRPKKPFTEEHRRHMSEAAYRRKKVVQ